MHLNGHESCSNVHNSTSARLWNLDFFKLWLSVTGTLCHHDHRCSLCCLSHHHHTTSPVSITKGVFGNASFYHYLRVFMTCQWLSFSLMTHLWLSSPPTQPSSMLASLTTNELWRHSFHPPNLTEGQGRATGKGMGERESGFPWQKRSLDTK